MQQILESILELHRQIRDTVVNEMETRAVEDLSSVAREDEGDTIYAIDEVSEELVIEHFRKVADRVPLILVAEGLPGGTMVLPSESEKDDAQFVVIVDPIDGTRGLMYQKRSAWILTGVARNRGNATSLKDIEIAVQTEIPVVKQHLSDQIWTGLSGDVEARRYNRISGTTEVIKLRPSSAESIAHGFATVSRFFPGVREELASIDEEMVTTVLGPVVKGKALCYEDQYISTGGQLYELMAGHDRFVADLRPLMEPEIKRRGLELGICCHPYDLCTELIARRLGIEVTDEHGNQIGAPLDVASDVSWIGYANSHIRHQIEPSLRRILQKRQLL